MICQAFETAIDIKMTSFERSTGGCYTRSDMLAGLVEKGEEG